jgi:3-oxoadipate enol-lactonase
MTGTQNALRTISAAALGLFFLLASASAQATQPAQTNAVVPGHFAQVPGAKLFYEECNAAAPISVVLLHDGLLHSVTWDGVWAPLCAKYHVVRYDRRGFGRSDTATAPFAPEEDLFQLMRLVKMDHAIIVGNSSGGGMSLDFALAHPGMSEGLFLIGPPRILRFNADRIIICLRWEMVAAIGYNRPWV